MRVKPEEYELIQRAEIEDAGILSCVFDETDKPLRSFVLNIRFAPGSENVSVGVEIYSSGQIIGYCWLINAISTTERVVNVYGKSDGGFIVIENTHPTNTAATVEQNQTLCRNVRLVDSSKTITRVSFYGAGAKEIPVGSIAELWGVRA